MPEVGDRVVTLTPRVDRAPRQGEVLEVLGSFLRVRWADGAETIVSRQGVVAEKMSLAERTRRAFERA